MEGVGQSFRNSLMVHTRQQQQPPSIESKRWLAILCILLHLYGQVVESTHYSMSTYDYRSYDGVGNNINSFSLGAAGNAQLRLCPVSLTGTTTASLQSAAISSRGLSNLLSTPPTASSYYSSDFSPTTSLNIPEAISGTTVSERGISDVFTYLGLFVVNDIVSTSLNAPSPSIKIPRCDEAFDRTCIGDIYLLYQSSQKSSDGADIYNGVTSFIDLSPLYGSSRTVAEGLRTFTDGKLKSFVHPTAGEVPLLVSVSSLSPSVAQTLPYHLQQPTSRTVFLLGDMRSNGSPGLLAIHTLFLREHNRIAAELKKEYPTLIEEDIYQKARLTNIAQFQKIIYSEFLPMLFGSDSLHVYPGYSRTEDPRVSVEFSSLARAAFHSALRPATVAFQEVSQGDPDDGTRVGSNLGVGSVITEGGAFQPSAFLENSLTALLTALHLQTTGNTDRFYHNQFRSSPGGQINVSAVAQRDLLAEHIQRGRDNNLCSYTDLRASLALSSVSDFSSFISDSTLSSLFRGTYNSVAITDAVAGTLIEGLSVGTVGETFMAVFLDQFRRLREADRYWYQHTISDSEQMQVTSVTLKDIMAWNANVQLPNRNVLYVPSSQLADKQRFLLPSYVATASRTTYIRSVSFEDVFLLQWSVDAKAGILQVQMSARTSGWIGIGFGGGIDGMAGADIIWGYISSLGKVIVEDSHATGEWVPIADTTLGGTRDIFAISGKYRNGTTSISFSRALNTTDTSYDVSIPNQRMRVLWAIGSNLPVASGAVLTSDGATAVISAHHGYSRGVAALNFFDMGPDPSEKVINKYSQKIQFDSNYEMAWKLESHASYITFQMTVQGQGWVGVGIKSDFSDDMDDADLIIVRFNGTAMEALSLHSMSNGMPQVDIPSGAAGTTANQLTLVSASRVKGVTTAVLRRPLDAVGTFRHNIGEDVNSVLWAYGISDDMSYHGILNRGAAKIDFTPTMEGVDSLEQVFATALKDSVIVPLKSFNGPIPGCTSINSIPGSQSVHGGLMLVSWGLVSQLGILLGALRSNSAIARFGMSLHALTMGLVILCTLADTIFIIASAEKGLEIYAHSVLGLTLCFCAILQGVLGAFSMKEEDPYPPYITQKGLIVAHKYYGLFVWLLAQTNCVVGIALELEITPFVVVVYLTWIFCPAMAYLCRGRRLRKSRLKYFKKPAEKRVMDIAAQKAEFRRLRWYTLKDEHEKANAQLRNRRKDDSMSVSSSHSSQSKSVMKITMEEVAKHNKEDDCWVVLNNTVLDITPFLNDHPGGKDKLISHAGMNVTEPFTKVGHSTFAMKMVGWYEKGILVKRNLSTAGGGGAGGGGINGDEDGQGAHDLLELGEIPEYRMMMTPGVYVGKLSDLAEGKLLKKSIQGTTFLMFRSGDRVAAFEELCPHQRAPLEAGVVKKDCIICPWHGAQFNGFTGEIEEAPSNRKLLTHGVDIRNGKIFIEIREPPPLDYFTGYNRQADSRTVVIVGAGAAGTSCAETLRKGGFEGRIILITKESVLPYDRTWLSKGLGLGMKHEAMILHDERWFEERDIQLISGAEVISLSASERLVRFLGSPPLRYDLAVISTGGTPRRLDVPGSTLKNICYFRTHSDQQKLEHLASSEKNVVIIGGGFIAMEIGSCLALLCKSVTQICRYGYPMHMVGSMVGDAMKLLHEANKVRFIVNVEVKEFRPDKTGESVGIVILSNGLEIPANLVIIAIGITPNTEFLTDIPINSDGSITVDSCMRIVGVPGHWAAGDIVTYPVPSKGFVRNEHWKTALQQGSVVARSILDPEESGLEFRIGHIFWTVQFGRNFRFAGHGISVVDNEGKAILAIIDGNLDQMKMIVYYVKSNGELLGVLTCSMDPIASIAAELFKDHEVPLFQIEHRENPRLYTDLLLKQYNCDVLFMADPMGNVQHSALMQQKEIRAEVERLEVLSASGGRYQKRSSLDNILQEEGGTPRSEEYDGSTSASDPPTEASSPGASSYGGGQPGAGATTSAPASPANSAAGSGPPAESGFTSNEVAKHNSASDCWIIVKKSVLDVTSFIDEHPGGRNVILRFAGKDATDAFEAKGHSKFAQSMLKWYHKGDLL